MTLPLSKEQIESIQTRAVAARVSQTDHHYFMAWLDANFSALCQQALRAIELEAMFQFEGDDAAHMKPNDPALKDGIVVRRDHFDEMLKRQHSLQSELTATRKALENILRCDDEAKQAAGIEGATLNGYGLVDLFDVLDHPFGVGPHKQSAYRSNDLSNALSMARAALPSPQVKP